MENVLVKKIVCTRDVTTGCVMCGRWSATQIIWQVVKPCHRETLHGICWECDTCSAIWHQWVESNKWCKPVPHTYLYTVYDNTLSGPLSTPWCWQLAQTSPLGDVVWSIWVWDLGCWARPHPRCGMTGIFQCFYWGMGHSPLCRLCNSPSTM